MVKPSISLYFTRQSKLSSQLMKYKKTLIIEGGGFKTAFSAGILDTFMVNDYFPFDRLIGISGGSIVLSYYLSRQYNACYSGLKFLGNDKEFVKFNRILSPDGYMKIDYLKKMTTEVEPLEIENALKHAKGKLVEFIATKRKNGKAAFLEPNKKSWIDQIIASSTLPYVTKGKHKIDGVSYFDGGWSDPLPVQKAYESGSNDIVVIRTNPADLKLNQSWPDYFGSYYFRNNKSLAKCFEKSHEKFNETIDFMKKPPKDLKISQIAPKRLLKSGTYSYSTGTLKKDYRYGLEFGLNFLAKQKK